VPAPDCLAAASVSPGERVFKPAETLAIAIQGFSPGGGASHCIPFDADDQANISGLSLKPALTGFCQMYMQWYW